MLTHPRGFHSHYAKGCHLQYSTPTASPRPSAPYLAHRFSAFDGLRIKAKLLTIASKTLHGLANLISSPLYSPGQVPPEFFSCLQFSAPSGLWPLHLLFPPPVGITPRSWPGCVLLIIHLLPPRPWPSKSNSPHRTGN